MKLIRYGIPGKEKPGICIEDTWYDTSHLARDYDEDFFESGGIKKLASDFDRTSAIEIDKATRLGPPVKRPGKIVCIGLNYKNHALESGMEIPEEPVVFLKATSSVIGPNDDIIIPKNSTKTDWEVELAVVIGKRASYVDEDKALDYVAGYMLHNDVSEREFQLERGGQWVKGKSCDSFAPLGPWLVTKDEIPDPGNLKLCLSVNGTRVQDANTSDFIFGVPYVISYLSRFMSLMPGDIISTGTPEGVGFGQKPPAFLKDGDIVELGIEGLGTAKQHVRDWSPQGF